MPAASIPKPVAALITKCWPGGVVEEFATDESWFEEVRYRLERDLGKIRGACLRWQTEAEETNWDDDDFEYPPLDPEWQSYHVFFVAPDAEEFHFEDEIEPWEEPDERDAEADAEWPESGTGTIPGEGWMGYTIRIFLAVPVAAVNMSSFSRFEDGSFEIPEDPRGADEQYRASLGDKDSGTWKGCAARSPRCWRSIRSGFWTNGFWTSGCRTCERQKRFSCRNRCACATPSSSAGCDFSAARRRAAPPQRSRWWHRA